MASDDRPIELTRLPPSPPGEPTPRPVTILVVGFILFVYAFWPIATNTLLAALGFGPHLTGAQPTPDQAAALTRVQLLANALAFPFQVASILLGLPRLTGIRLEQIGLTTRRLGWNCLYGVAGWLLLTPLCLAVNWGVVSLYGSEAASNVQEHPFTRMAAQGLSPSEWFLLILAATVTAPFLEETLFRGALQSWLERRAWASHIVMCLAVLAATAMKAGDIYAAAPHGGRELLIHLTPVLFIVCLAVAYAVICLATREPAAPAVFAASTLFASIHSFAWPSPVALFVLALGLGWLAQRTRSLAGPMVLHGLFNGVSCVLLFFPQSGVKP